MNFPKFRFPPRSRNGALGLLAASFVAGTGIGYYAGSPSPRKGPPAPVVQQSSAIGLKVISKDGKTVGNVSKASDSRERPARITVSSGFFSKEERTVVRYERRGSEIHLPVTEDQFKKIAVNK